MRRRNRHASISGCWILWCFGCCLLQNQVDRVCVCVYFVPSGFSVGIFIRGDTISAIFQFQIPPYQKQTRTQNRWKASCVMRQQWFIALFYKLNAILRRSYDDALHSHRNIQTKKRTDLITSNRCVIKMYLSNFVDALAIVQIRKHVIKLDFVRKNTMYEWNNKNINTILSIIDLHCAKTNKLRKIICSTHWTFGEEVNIK